MPLYDVAFIEKAVIMELRFLPNALMTLVYVYGFIESLWVHMIPEEKIFKTWWSCCGYSGMTRIESECNTFWDCTTLDSKGDLRVWILEWGEDPQDFDRICLHDCEKRKSFKIPPETIPPVENAEIWAFACIREKSKWKRYNQYAWTAEPETLWNVLEIVESKLQDLGIVFRTNVTSSIKCCVL